MTEIENLKDQPGNNLRVLILFFSFSGQTAGLLSQLSASLKEQGISVVYEKLRPINPLRFPLNTVFSTLVLMITTFLRFRIPIQPLSSESQDKFNLIILAGPTWSYNPSGPVLSLLDRDGKKLFSGGQVVIPLISCRGYWRLHWYGLKRLLKKCGAITPNLIVFSHPNKEPWRTLGVFLKIAGKSPERSKVIGKYYQHYGHSKQQLNEAWRFGLQLGDALRRHIPLSDLNFQTKTSLP